MMNLISHYYILTSSVSLKVDKKYEVSPIEENFGRQDKINLKILQLFGTYPSTKPLKLFIWLWVRICDLAHVVAKFSMNIGLPDFLFLYTETEREKRQTVVSPTFQNFVFHERPALIPVFANLKMSEENFCLCEKR